MGTCNSKAPEAPYLTVEVYRGLCAPSMDEVPPKGFCTLRPSFVVPSSGTVTPVTMVPMPCCDIDTNPQNSYSEASTCASWADGARSPPATTRVARAVPSAFPSATPRAPVPDPTITRRCHSEGNVQLHGGDVQLPRGGSFDVNKASPIPRTPKSTLACWPCLPLCAFFSLVHVARKMPEGPGSQYYPVCQVSLILFNTLVRCLAFAKLQLRWWDAGPFLADFSGIGHQHFPHCGGLWGLGCLAPEFCYHLSGD